LCDCMRVAAARTRARGDLDHAMLDFNGDGDRSNVSVCVQQPLHRLGTAEATSTGPSRIMTRRSSSIRRCPSLLRPQHGLGKEAPSTRGIGRFQGIADAICWPRASRAEHTVEKSLLFARRVALGSAIIRFIEAIVRCPPLVERRPRCRVGKTRSGGNHALIGMNNGVSPVCVMHRGRVRSVAQADQKAQSQNRTHRFFSERPAPPP